MQVEAARHFVTSETGTVIPQGTPGEVMLMTRQYWLVMFKTGFQPVCRVEPESDKLRVPAQGERRALPQRTVIYG